jgi:hypothetical protein
MFADKGLGYWRTFVRTTEEMNILCLLNQTKPNRIDETSRQAFAFVSGCFSWNAITGMNLQVRKLQHVVALI